MFFWTVSGDSIYVSSISYMMFGFKTFRFFWLRKQKENLVPIAGLTRDGKAEVEADDP